MLSPPGSSLRRTMMKLSLFAFLSIATVVAAAAPPPVHQMAMGQQARQDGLYLGSKAKHTVVQGTLEVGTGTDGGSLYSDAIRTPVLRADIVDAGLLYVQGTGPIVRILPFTTAAIDFATGTIVCADSAGTTVTGARTGDSCIVGMPSTLTAGGTGLHHSFTCYVSAADTIKIRQCAAGTADDPGSVVFTGYVISAVQ